MVDFMMAMTWMKEGRKVRREEWNADHSSMFIHKDTFWWDKNDVEVPTKVLLEHIEAVDWVEFIKKRTLSDKVIYPTQLGWVKEKPQYPEDDVKEFISRFLEKAKEITEDRYDFYWLAKELAGDKLM